MENLIMDFKSGPLDEYRHKTSFNWKNLKVFMETEELLRFENEVYKILESIPVFTMENVTTKSCDEQRKIAFQAYCRLMKIKELSWSNLSLDLKRPAFVSRILTATAVCSYVRQILSSYLFANAVKSMGTLRHKHFFDDAQSGKIVGCYCLTEIGHGSNTRSMRTTATYDKMKKVFVLNSSDFEAAKCWSGGLGQTATYGVVYAQLIIDQMPYGLHGFIVPLRDPQTLLPYPGLEIGDMGEKLGVNGLDNGFVRFLNYEIPRINLLNKLADVTEDGSYITSIKEPSKRHGTVIAVLSSGRINLGCMIESLGTKALTIAIRYAAVRKQLGPTDRLEIPILEYQSHQLRLLPYLAAIYVIRNFNTYFSERFYKFTTNNEEKSQAVELGMEFHGISSASKPIIGWIMKEAVQECREACGGHGYLHAAGIGDIRNEVDATTTTEGENYVIIQQTVNWLLKLTPRVFEGKEISSPLESISFLTDGLDILKNSKFTARNIDEICCPYGIVKIFHWIVTYLLKATHDKVKEELKSGKDLFSAKNNSQVYYGRSLAIAFIQCFFIQRMLVKISEAEDSAIKAVLSKLCSLFGLWAIEKWHIATIYKGGFASNSTLPLLIHDAILKLCADLKDDAVALVDVIAVPDFALKSVLGASDGYVYQHLKDSITKNKYNMSRPMWWKDVVDFTQRNINSKL